MKRIFAIAAIAVRNAIRSRVAMILLGFLLLAALGLPLTVKGDGTIEGRVRIVLSYTMGAAGFILAIASLWAGCSSISSELDEKQMHLIVTKPARRSEIWLGKWLGLMALNTVLLFIAGAIAYTLLLWTARPGRLPPAARQTLAEEILIARRPCPAEPVNVEPEARRELERMRAHGEIPAGTPASAVYQNIRQALLNKAFAIPPGQKHVWTYHLPRAKSGGHSLLARFRFSTSMIGPAPVKIVWMAGPASDPARFRLEQESIAGPQSAFLIPASAVEAGQPFLLTCENTHPEPITLVFDPQDGAQLLAREGTFTGNFARALLLQLFHLALLSALGVTAGSLFSMPVASFASLFFLLLLGMSRLIQGIATQGALLAPMDDSGAAPGAWTILLRLVYKSIYAVMRPLDMADPFQMVSTGLLIPWSQVASVFLIKTLLYAGALALLGVWVLNRREIALPGAEG